MAATELLPNFFTGPMMDNRTQNIDECGQMSPVPNGMNHTMSSNSEDDNIDKDERVGETIVDFTSSVNESTCQETSKDPSLPSSSTPTPDILSRSEEIINPMMTDPTLPPGWSRKVTQRTMGASAGKFDVYIFSPDRKKIRSRTDLLLYLNKNNLDLNVNDFDFSVRGRANTPAKRAAPKSTKQPKPKKPKIVIPKPPKTTNTTQKKVAKPSTSHTRSVANSQIHSSATNNSQKLIVKFNFPIARLKRSTSMKVKKSKKKAVRQDSQTSQTSQHSLTSPTFEYHEELSNGETRLTNGLDMDDLQMFDESNS